MSLDYLKLLYVFFAGMGIGALYFLGLWWTVRLLPRIGLAALWTITSFVVRSGIAMAGFYMVMEGQWQNLLMCTAGFTLMRLWLVRKLTPALPGPARASRFGRHAGLDPAPGDFDYPRKGKIS